MQLRPSLKFIKAGYVVCLLMAVAIAVYWLTNADHPNYPIWAPLAVPAFLALILVVRHIQRSFIKLLILGDRLRYEAGMLSKSTRTIELAKVQDVRVDQTLSQRISGIGDLSLETAGGSSRIVMHSIDNPQQAADHILGLARTQREQPNPPSHGV
jgi:membrane protein YdbS with pleckstrin-like domain